MPYRVLIITIILIVSARSELSAQDRVSAGAVFNPPISIEGLVGNRGIFYQAIITKKFQSVPKLGIFSVASMLPEWKKKSFDDLMYQVNLSYQILNGLNIAGGFIYTTINGFRPSAGVIYSKGSPSYTIVVAPRIDISRNAGAETLVFAEYMPSINDNWRLYTRLQGLYTLLTNSGDHARSYIMIRAGLKYKEFAFGLGGNLDWYGENRLFKNQIGGFVNVELF